MSDRGARNLLAPPTDGDRAVPVGAAARHSMPFMMAQRKTVVSKKLLPVPALAWTINRSGLPSLAASFCTMCE